MKKLILLLLVFNSAYGQGILKLPEGFNGTTKGGDTLPRTLISGGGAISYRPYPYGYIENPSKTIDTVKVFMQVNDTTPQYHINYYATDSGQVKDTVRITYNIVNYGMYGYKVIKFIPAGWGYYDKEIFPHWKFEKYLDADKKPLKNIVVWKAIEIK